MADLDKKNSSSNTRIVGADNGTGLESNFAEITPNQDLRTTDTIFTTMVDADLNPAASPGVTAYANVNDTALGNLTDRKQLLLENLGKTVRVRLDGSSATGIKMSKNESIVFNFGDAIVLEIREANNANELNVYIAEYA